jgi:prophage tail gpP-like protein
MKLNGDCGSYNNLFFVWEFKDVAFTINSSDDQDIQGTNCKIISTPHKDFTVKAKPEDLKAQSKRKKKENAKKAAKAK